MARIVKNIFMFLMTFCIMIIIIDRYVSFAEIIQVTIYEYDDRLGRVFVNNASYTLLTEGFAAGSINSFGYIGPGYSRNKDEKKLRIALLGDSYVEGFQHFDRNHIRAVLERELKKRNVDAEVMNFGKFGYNLMDMYCYNVNYVSGFKPDLVLYFLSNEDLHEIKDDPGMPYPYVENDSLKIFYYKDVTEKKPWFLSLNKMGMISPLVQMLRNCISLYHKGLTAKIMFGKFYTDPVNEKENQTADGNLAPGIVHKKILEALARDPAAVIVNRDEKGFTPGSLKEIIRSKIKYIDLNDIINKMKAERIEPYFRDRSGKTGHWNSRGHEAIGIFLADKIHAF